MGGLRYTNEEISKVQRLAAEGLKPSLIAKQIGRNACGISRLMRRIPVHQSAPNSTTVQPSLFSSDTSVRKNKSDVIVDLIVDRVMERLAERMTIAPK